MAENYEHPGGDEPRPTPPAGADFPADFFDDAAEPSPVSAGSEPEHHPQTHPHPVAPSYIPPQKDDEPKKASIFPFVLGALMLLSLIAAWIISKQPKEEAPAASTTPAAAPATPTPSPVAEAPAASAATDAVAGEVKEVKSQLEGLAAQIKALQAKIEAAPKPDTSADIKPIQAKVDDLAKSVATLAPLADKVGKIDEKVTGVEKALKSVKEEVSTLADEVKKLAAAKPAAAAPAEDTGAAMTQGIELFKAGKYKEAEEVFKKLEAANPQDARVYYYEALLNGLNTGNWQGDTLKIAAKGAALEKAGTTKAADVDAAFADLPPKLKPWLDFFRKQAK